MVCIIVTTARRRQLVATPVTTKNAQEGASELLIGQRVAERVDGTVEIAQPIGHVVDDHRNPAERLRIGPRRTEADQQRENVPRRPADQERAQYDGDGTQRLPRAILPLAAASAGTRFRDFLTRTSLITGAHTHTHARRHPQIAVSISEYGVLYSCGTSVVTVTFVTYRS